MRRNRRPTRSIQTAIYLIILGLFFFFSSSSSRAGAKESPAVANDLFAAAIVSENTYLMIGDRGTILLSEDRGKTWKTVAADTKRALAAICFPDDQNGWIVGQEGVILFSSDQGRTWRKQPSGVATYLLDVDFFDKNSGCAVGADSTIVVTVDGGRTWKAAPFKVPQDLGEQYNLFIVVMIEAHKICIGGDGGRIFLSEDDGQKWTEIDTPLYDPDMMEGRILYSMVKSSGMLYAAGIDGVLVSFSDGGNTWKETETGFPGPELYCLDMVEGMGLAAGLGGHIIETFDGGKSWRLVDVPEKTTRFFLSGLDLKKADSGKIYGLVAGQNGTYACFADGKWTWK